MVRAIYSNFSEHFWLDVSQYLAGEFDWEPVYWVGIDWMQSFAESQFPNTIFQPTVDAVKGIPPAGFDPSEGWPIDKTLLDQLARAQLTAVNMMDRMDALDSFTYSQRVRHFYRQVGYWSAVIDRLQPEIVVFKEIPHMVFDYILYELCRIKRIRTMMFQITSMRSLWLMKETLYDQHAGIQLYHKMLADGVSPDQVELSEHLDTYLQSLRAFYEDVPMFVRFVSKDDLRVSTETPMQKLASLGRYPKFIRKQLAIWRKKLKPPRNYLVQHGKTPETSAMTASDYRRFRRESKAKMDPLVAYYAQLARTPDLERKYVYIALTFQPEANSSPLGGVYADIQLMIELISRSVPEDWVLYVKEHPSELHPDWAWRAQACRSRTFYDDILAIPKVRFVPNDASSYDLIDHAKAVATLTGTTAWQAVNRGVPGMIFGYPWYQGCEGIYHIETIEDCQQAIDQINTGVDIDLGKIRLFVHALEQSGVSAYVDELWRDYVPFDSDPQRMAEAINGFFRQKKQSVP